MNDYGATPNRIFRYFWPSRSKILSEKILRFASADQFNDVFEAFPRFDALVREQFDNEMRKAFTFLPPHNRISFSEFKHDMSKKWPEEKTLVESERITEELQAKFSEEFGIVCFTENLDSLLMWGHYADGHKGFVIEFKPGHNLFATPNFGKVQYGNERPIASRKAEPIIFMHKSGEWKYEAEYRMVRHKSELKRDEDGHFLPLPMDSVKAVYFGCRIAKDHRDQLLDALKEHSEIQTFAMRRNKLEFKLDIIPWRRD